MVQVVLRRVAHAGLVLWGVSTIVFMLTHLSGDPTNLMLPPDATFEERVEFSERLGFNRPLIVQYGDFLGDAAVLDFGDSLRFDQPAMEIVWERVPATLELTTAAMALAVLVAVPLGALAATHRGSWIDSISLVTAIGGQSLPVFWLGLMLILGFSETLHWLPSGGRGGFDHLILPAFTLSVLAMAMIMRITRSAMLDVLGADYVRTARAKGLRERIITYRHVARNAAIPVVTIAGLALGLMLGGAVITETVFAWPGIGRLVIQAISNRDFPVVQAYVFLIAIVIVVLNLLVDFLYIWINPQVRIN